MQLTPLCGRKIGAILARNLGYIRIAVYRAAQLMRNPFGRQSINDFLIIILCKATYMSFADVIQQLDTAIALSLTDQVLCIFLQLILTVERTIQYQTQLIERVFPPSEQEAYASTFTMLRKCDMLSFVTARAPETITSVRRLIEGSEATLVTNWYRKQWNQPNWSGELILASIANSLRAVMTIVLGNIELLRRQQDVFAEHQVAMQAAIDAIETLRATRTRIGLYLTDKGVTITLF